MAMSQINPFTGAIIQSTQAQQVQSGERQRQVRRVQNLVKNSALQGDQLEHQVESADALHPAGDRPDSYQPQSRQQKRRQPQPGPNEDGHVDFTA